MNYQNPRDYMIASYIQRAESSRRKAVAMLVIQGVLLLVCMLLFDNKLLPACITMALLRVGKHIGIWNTEQIYIEDDYDSEGRYWGTYETRGTFIGGMIKWLIGAGIALYLGTRFLENNFPADIPGFRFALTAIAVWVMGVPMVHRVMDIINANRLIEELVSKQRLQEETQQKQDDRRDEVCKVFHIVMALAVVAAIIFQFISFWIGGAVREKKFDDVAYEAYLEYREGNPDSPALTQAWFENALEDHHGFTKYKSETVLTGGEEIVKNERTYELISQISFEHYDKKWHVTDVAQEIGEVLSANISGTWAGSGEDKLMVYKSGEIRSIITLESMTAEQAVGYITGTFRGETMYYATFNAEVTTDGDYMVVTGVTNEEISGWGTVDVQFAYDPAADTILYAAHAYDIVFERQ